jgi:hypothetical protein
VTTEVIFSLVFFRAKKQHEETVLEVFNLQQQVNQLSSQNKRLEMEVETLRSDSNETILRKQKPLKLTMEDDLVPENAKKSKKQQTGSPDETEMPRSNKDYVRKRKPLKLTIEVPENDDDNKWRSKEASRGKRRRNQEQEKEAKSENQPVASASVTGMVQPAVSTAGSQSKKPNQQAHIQPKRLPAQGPLQTTSIRPTAMRTSAAASMRSTVGPSMVASVSPSTSEFVPSSEEATSEEETSEEETVEETPNLAHHPEGRVDPVDLALKNRNWF